MCALPTEAYVVGIVASAGTQTQGVCMQSLLEGGTFNVLFFPLFVDVRDCALAHIRAAENPSAKVCFCNPNSISIPYQIDCVALQDLLG